MPTRNVLVDTTTMQKHLILEEIFKIIQHFKNILSTPPKYQTQASYLYTSKTAI